LQSRAERWFKPCINGEPGRGRVPVGRKDRLSANLSPAHFAQLRVIDLATPFSVP